MNFYERNVDNLVVNSSIYISHLCGASSVEHLNCECECLCNSQCVFLLFWGWDYRIMKIICTRPELCNLKITFKRFEILYSNKNMLLLNHSWPHSINHLKYRNILNAAIKPINDKSNTILRNRGIMTIILEKKMKNSSLKGK